MKSNRRSFLQGLLAGLGFTMVPAVAFAEVPIEAFSFAKDFDKAIQYMTYTFDYKGNKIELVKAIPDVLMENTPDEIEFAKDIFQMLGQDFKYMIDNNLKIESGNIPTEFLTMTSKEIEDDAWMEDFGYTKDDLHTGKVKWHDGKRIVQ